MGRATVVIRSATDKQRAANWLSRAPFGTRIDFKAAKRTLPQNDRLWAMLTDVSDQLTWHGNKLRASDWKLVFMDALKREMKLVPNIDGTGFVNLSNSSSDLSKGEMSDLIELIFKFGAEHGVEFQGSEVA